MSKLGYTSVIFVDLGAKVDGIYYCDLLLSQQLLPAIRRVLIACLYFRKQCPSLQGTLCFQTLIFHKVVGVATLLKRDGTGICNDLFIANFRVSVAVKEF